MLQLVKNIRFLDFSQLAEVYSESLGAVAGKRDSDNLYGLHAQQDFYNYLRDFFSLYGGIYALWVVDGCYRAAARLEPYRDGYLISGLETSPTERRKGYAKQLLVSVLEYASCNKLGRIYSHIANDNVISIRLHLSCGFQKILDHAVYIDGSVYHNSATFCYDT